MDSEKRKTIAANFILCYDGKYKKKTDTKNCIIKIFWSCSAEEIL